MKHSVLIVFAMILLAGITFTGFQCGSAESTSAKLYIHNKDFPAAEKSLLKELEKAPNNAEAWFLLGDVRRQMGDYKGMVSAFDRSLQINKTWESNITASRANVWVTSLNQGVALFNKSRSAPADSANALCQKAVESYKTALVVNPDSTVTYHHLAVAYMAMDSVDHEITYLKMGLERKRDPDNTEMLMRAFLKKAEKSLESKDTAICKNELATAIEVISGERAIDGHNKILDTTFSDIHSELGTICLRQDSLETAVRHFDIALLSDSSSQGALLNGAIACIKWGAGIQEASKANKSPKDQGLESSYKEKYQHGVSMLEKYVQLKDDNASAWEILGTTYGYLGKQKEAQVAIKKADALKKK